MNQENTQTNNRTFVPARLTPDNSVIILIDYLTELMMACRSIDQATLRNNAVALAKMGAVLEIPTILLGDEGSLNGPFMPEIEQAASKDLIKVARHTPSAMDEPEFVKTIEKIGRPNLIMAGITTDNCLMMLALDAKRAGYESYVVADASACFNSYIDQVALLRLTAAGIPVMTWVALGSELGRNWEDPKAAGVLKIYNEHSGELANMANNLHYYKPGASVK